MKGAGGMAVQAFPNPAQDNLQVRWAPTTDQPTTLLLFDMSGRILAEYLAPTGSSTFEFPLDRLPAGLYTLQLRQGHDTETLRFHKQ